MFSTCFLLKTPGSDPTFGPPEDTAKLIFFENLFFMLDSDSNGLILIEETASFFFGNTETRLMLGVAIDS